MKRPRPKRSRRWHRPPRVLKPTRAGWSFFVLTLCVGFAALNTGNNLLYLVLSLMLAFLILSGILSESALRGIRLQRVLPNALHAGARNRVVLRVSNTQRRITAFAIVAEDVFEVEQPLPMCLAEGETQRPHDASDDARVFALRIGAGEVVSRSYVFVPGQRGWWRFREIRISTHFPFGLFVKSRLIELEDRVVVYPQISALDVHDLGRANEQEFDSPRSQLGQGVEVSGLREFQPGDPARRINWKPSMRRGQLLVSEVDESMTGEVEVRLVTRGDSSAPDARAAFEVRVARAASECAAYLEAGVSVGLRTETESIAPGAGGAQRARLLHFLALVEPDSNASVLPGDTNAGLRRAS